MSATAWGKFFWADWMSDPGLRACSIGARGMWMDLLCVAATHDPPGYVAIGGRTMSMDEMARLSGIDVATANLLVSELKSKNVCSQTMDGTIYSRRIIRDYERGGQRCEQCGKPYNPKRSHSQYCSLGCKQLAYRNRNANRNAKSASVTDNVTDKVLRLGGKNRNTNGNGSVTKSVTNVTVSVTDPLPIKPKKTSKINRVTDALRLPRGRARSTCQNPDKNLTSSVASESEPTNDQTGVPTQPTSGPATALPEGRAGPPSFDSKKPHELTKAEFEAQIAKRKSGGP